MFSHRNSLVLHDKKNFTNFTHSETANGTSTSPLRFDSPFTTMNPSAPSTKIVRRPLPSSANRRARLVWKKINRGPKDRTERKDHRAGVHAREHRSDNNTSGCLLLFSAPGSPPGSVRDYTVRARWGRGTGPRSWRRRRRAGGTWDRRTNAASAPSFRLSPLKAVV